MIALSESDKILFENFYFLEHRSCIFDISMDIDTYIKIGIVIMIKMLLHIG